MKKLILVVAGCLCATGAWAEEGFQLSLVPDVALHSRSTQISGFSLNVWGENPQTGFALGFVNGATGSSSGVLWGMIANYSDNYKGAQLGSFVNIAKGEMTGVQWSAGFNYAEKLNGAQLGFVNYARSVGSGFQVGCVNLIAENPWFSNFPQGLAPAMVFVNWKF